MGKREWKFSVYETPEGCDVVWDMRFPMEPGKFHVIEYQAFEAVVKERDSLRSANLSKQIFIDQIEKESRQEINALKAQLAEAKRREQLAADVDSDNQDVITKLQMQLSDLKREAMKLREALTRYRNINMNSFADDACAAFDAFMAQQDGAE